MITLTAEEAKLQDPADAGEITFTLKFNPKGLVRIDMSSTIEFPDGLAVRDYVAKDELAIDIVQALTSIQDACDQQMAQEAV